LSLKRSLKRIILIAACVIVALIVVAGIIITTYDYNKLKPQIENAFKEATGRQLTLKGNLGLKLGLSPTLVVNNAAMSNASWGTRPNMAEIGRFEVQLALIPLIFRRVEVRRVSLVNPDILIETNPAGESNLDFLKRAGTEKAKEKQKGPGAAEVRLTVDEMKIKDGRLTYRNGKSRAAYVIALQRFDASAKSAGSPVKLSIQGSYNGKAFEVSGNAVPLASLNDTGRPWPLDLKASIGGANIGIAGSIRDVAGARGIDLKVTAQSKDAKRMGEALGVSLPIEGALDLSCRVTDPRPKVYRMSDLKLLAGGSDMVGSAGIDLSGSRTLVSADVRSSRIDLRSPSGKGQPVKAANKPAGKVFPNTPLPFDALQSIDANIGLRAAEVLTSQIVLRSLDMRASLVDGRLTVKPLRAVIGGGNLDGSVDLTSRGKSAQLATNVTIRRLDVGAMFRELKKSAVLEGHADVNVNAGGSGASVAGIMSTLNGNVYAIMGEGKINNKYMGILGSNVFSGLLRMVNPLNKQKPETSLSCMVAGFKVKAGIAETTALVLNSDYMSVVGNGTVNLRTEGLDLSLKPIAKEGIGTGLTGKINLSLGELTRPFKLAGTLSHPSLAVDFQQTAVTAAKALGGMALFGPAGLGSALLGSSSTGEKQLCPLAMQAAERGVKLSDLEKKQDKSITGRASQGAGQVVEGVKKGLEKLFGR
jgi:uncharacterized protein involved in outer membrane biogenesis